MGPLNSRLFKAALQTGKRVRSETKIGARQLSLPASRSRSPRSGSASSTGRGS